jgi:aryl-alcohol dehydrogenase-like predicted oxidoreductase
MIDRAVHRRDFLSSLAAFGVGVAAGGGEEAVPSVAGNAAVRFSAWDEVELGKTGIKTTRLGFGTGVNSNNRSCGLVRRHGHDGAVKIVRAAYEKGVRFFDSADSYGTHALLREALAPFPRASYVVCSKYWFRNGGIPQEDHTDVESSVDRFLRELGTDHIDVVQLHCVSAPDWTKALERQMAALERCKKAGKIRAHGCSFHGASALPAVQSEDWLDVAHVQVNPFGRNMGLHPKKTLECVRVLRERGKGVVGMKILGVGSLAKEGRIDASLEWTLKNGAADVLNIGFLEVAEIDDLARRIAAVV